MERWAMAGLALGVGVGIVLANARSTGAALGALPLPCVWQVPTQSFRQLHGLRIYASASFAG
jgi:hypothetical protein